MKKVSNRIFNCFISLLVSLNIIFTLGYVNIYGETNKYGFNKNNIHKYTGQITDKYKFVNMYLGVHENSFSYDDSWFIDNYSYTYNHDIAKFLYKAEMASFHDLESDDPAHDLKDLFNKLGYTYVDNTIINETLDSNDSIVYTDTKDGFDYTDTSTDTLGYGIAYKNVDFGGGNIITLIGVGTRGFGYEAEWASNFTIGESGDHEGFKQAAEHLESKLVEYIDVIDSPYPTCIWLTGYSRSGATIDILGNYLNQDALNGTLGSIKPENIFAYTFEAPLTKNNDAKEKIYQFANKTVSLNDNIFDIVNAIDLITQIPMDDMGFSRYGVTKVLPNSLTVSDYYNSDVYKTMLNNYKKILSSDYNMSLYVDELEDIVAQDKSQFELINCYSYALARLFNNDRSIYVKPSETNAQKALRLAVGGVQSDKELTQVDIYFTYGSGSKSSTLSIDLVSEDGLSAGAVTPFALSYLTNKDRAIDYYVTLYVADDEAGTNTKNETIKLSNSQFEFLVSCLPEKLSSALSASGISAVAKLVGLLTDKSELEDIKAYYKDLIKKVKYNHYAELDLSWLESGSELEVFKNARYNKVRLSAKGNLSVYYKGNKVAELSNSEVISNSIEAYIDENGDKVVDVPDDLDYTVVINLSSNASSSDKIHVDSYNINTGKYVIKTCDYSLSGCKSGDSFKININKDAEKISKNDVGVLFNINKAKDGDLTDVNVLLNTDTNKGSVTGGGRFSKYSYITLSAQAKTGYEFVGWYNEHNKLISKDATYLHLAKDNETITGVFKAIEYTITYDLGKGVTETINPSKYTIEDDSFTLVNPIAKGYEFVGWTYEGVTTPIKTVTINKGSTGNKTYKANYKLVNYTISYHLYGGVNSSKNPSTYTVEDRNITLYSPSKSNDEFMGWYLDSAFANKVSEIDVSECKNIDLYAKFKNEGMNINLASIGLKAGDRVYVDGQVMLVNSDNTINTSKDAKLLTTYVIHNHEDSDVHNQYPTDMKTYLLIHDKDGYGRVEHLSIFDNALTYAGTAIRITGKRGIRAITSIPTSLKNKLISSGINGYSAIEYGVIMCWAKDLSENEEPTLIKDNTGNYVALHGSKGRSYSRKDNMLKTYKEANNQTKFTSVLVGDYTNEQCASDFAIRPYIILKNGNDEFVLYGGTLYRSISYVAYQNRNDFTVGSNAYEYIWNLIKAGYGNKYDSEYKSN